MNGDHDWHSPGGGGGGGGEHVSKISLIKMRRCTVTFRRASDHENSTA